MLSGAGTIRGRLVDLSLGGCRMVTPEPVSLGILARVEVSFELRGCTFRVVGVTAGTRAKRSFGLRFLEMPRRRAEALLELLEELAEDPQGPRAVERKEPQPPMEPALIDSAVMDQAAAEARANRQKQSERAGGIDVPPVASEAAPVAEAEPGNADDCGKTAGISQDKGVERRSHQRHRVDTRVKLTLIRGAITMQGCIVNLSQGGCRLRTDEHFKVGIYTRVEAEFYLHGLPFRLAGVSQAIMDRNTIGVRFLDMSERKRAQLTELIAEIEEMQGSGDSV